MATTFRGLVPFLAAVFLTTAGCLPDASTPPPPAPDPAADPALTVDADALLDEFKENLFSAALQYKDKVIRVRGVCAAEEPGPDGRPCLQMRHSQLSTNTIHCCFGDAAALAGVRPGDAVSVVGLCREGNAWDVYLDGCRLEPAEKPQ